MSENKQNIVVVGSGGGGVPLVQALQKQINAATHQIVVIEKRDYYAHWPALIRASVTSDGSVEQTALIPLDRAFAPSVRLIHSSAKQITSTEVITDSGEHVPYVQLVLATGSLWNGAFALPDSRIEAMEHLKAFRKHLKEANNIVILGGGSIGVEYAGELAFYYPEKKVTIVHGPTALMNDVYPAKFRNSLLDGVKKMGVDVIFGDRISTRAIPEEGFLTTEKGQRVRADLVINATGGRPNSAVVSTLDDSAVTARGTVLVTPELNVKLASGARNVWAMGDIIDWPEQKMFAKVSRAHAPLVAANIIAAIGGTKLKSYKGMFEAILVTIGPKGGRASIPILGGIVGGDWMTSKAKSVDLFIKPIRKSLGYGETESGSGSSNILLGAGLLAVPVAYVLYKRLVV